MLIANIDWGYPKPYIVGNRLISKRMPTLTLPAEVSPFDWLDAAAGAGALGRGGAAGNAG